MASKYPCPYCGIKMTRETMVTHISDNHEDLIPEGYTPLRITFNVFNRRSMDYNGICTECKGPTGWDEKKGRYNRQCGKKSCHDSFVKKAGDNMYRVHGHRRMTDTAEGEEKMLAGRRISGVYKWSDGTEKTYMGSYEKEALTFLDQVMECKSEDVITPGPIMEYTYKGETHMYISDIYYAPYNLVIEVKDGGDRPNTRNMPDYRAKQIAKEEYVVKNTTYNYLRLTNKDFSQLLAVMADLKMNFGEDSKKKRVIHINENMFAATNGMMPPASVHNTYIVNAMQNNAFDKQSNALMISDSPKFDRIFYRDTDGSLKKSNAKVLEHCNYDVFLVEKDHSEVFPELEKHLGEFITENLLYKTVFGRDMYTQDQIYVTKEAIPVSDFYHARNAITETVYNSLKKPTLIPTLEGCVIDAKGVKYKEFKCLDESIIRLRIDDPVQSKLIQYFEEVSK